jgi:hypothetical protein
VNPELTDRAGQVLAGLGLEQLADDRAGEAFAEPHAVVWRRQRDRATVDLHWRIPGTAVDPLRAWEYLASGTEEVLVADTQIEALGKPARALHLVMHALHDGREGGQSLSDLARGIDRVDEAIWRQAARVAAELGASAPFAAGLRMLPEGNVLADALGLPRSVPVRWALWAQTPPPGAVRLYELTHTPGVWGKARALGAALVPSPAYIRGLYPSARKNFAALALAYIRRPLAGIRHAPGAIRAVRRARTSRRNP